ncbi:MAG: CxxxxCH/CxxCH domain-containing protein [Deltaproteobacteria bacterium]|nr:CxxxxCH/CxxCH domain-containing protein [Deltaproteobacteria bacterium]
MMRGKGSLRPFAGWLFLTAVAFAAGCSSANSTGGSVSVSHLTGSGVSVSGWVSASGTSLHSRTSTDAYMSQGNMGACTECHGADLLGGISRVSCMDNPAACHHGTVANWVAAGAATQEHGAAAKRGPGSSSMHACRICHGNDFRTDRGSQTCFTCHTLAPHPNRPWRTTGTDNTHTDVNAANAPICYGCHADSAAGNPNNPHRPPSPAASGTAPGCFNGTMCHNAAAAPHATGAAWLAAGTGFHGTGAKADLTFCQGCHGTPGTINFNGGSAPTSCSTGSCHPAAKAHPTDWQGLRTINGVTVSHRTSGNRDVACAICHRTTGTGAGPDPSAPSCFSANFTNALGQARACHSGGPGAAPHALGATWNDPAAGGSAFHGTTAKADLLFCRTCHGTAPRSFAGGTATTACTTCHTTAEAHPTDWQGIRAISTASISHRTSGNRTAACGICHNVTAAGAGPHPTAPSCFSANHTNGIGQARACHAGGPGAASHPVPFNDNTTHTQATTATFTADCGTCHAVTGTSPVSAAPICVSCHISDPRSVTNCASCHANPPNGAATAYPNVAGAHAAHLALNGAGTPVTCATCHNGLGSGTLSHYNRTRPTRVSPASVAFLTTYNAESGASAFDNSSLLRCGNISCHGGQNTPNWRTGTIDIVNACTSCHISGTTQFNSYFSGRHSLHLSRFGTSATTCKRCHDATKVNVTGHLTNLATPTVFEQTARSTVLTAVQFNGTSCNPSAGGLSGCHGSENW